VEELVLDWRTAVLSDSFGRRRLRVWSDFRMAVDEIPSFLKRLNDGGSRTSGEYVTLGREAILIVAGNSPCSLIACW